MKIIGNKYHKYGLFIKEEMKETILSIKDVQPCEDSINCSYKKACFKMIVLCNEDIYLNRCFFKDRQIKKYKGKTHTAYTRRTGLGEVL